MSGRDTLSTPEDIQTERPFKISNVSTKNQWFILINFTFYSLFQWFLILFKKYVEIRYLDI